MKPIDCNSEEAVCSLSESVVETKDFWMLTDGNTIVIHRQTSGESSQEAVRIPKRTFDAFVRWYQRDQRERKDKP